VPGRDSCDSRQSISTVTSPSNTSLITFIRQFQPRNKKLCFNNTIIARSCFLLYVFFCFFWIPFYLQAVQIL
jgi:hypothetical protein